VSLPSPSDRETAPGGAASPEPSLGTGKPRSGVPAPPGSAAGRAHRFRERQMVRRSETQQQLGVVVVVVIIVLGIYTLLTAHPYSASGTNGQPPQGPTIFVNLGTPTAGTTPCLGGGTAYVERIPWVNSTEPLTTGDVNLRVYEIWDRDYIADPNAVANATPTSVCAGVPPDPIALWYVVLAAPNGTNVLTYTQAHVWRSLSGSPVNVPIEDRSTLVLVTQMSLYNAGRGFQVYGYSNDSVVFGAIPL
jgi:hypothetical protein